MITKYIKNLLSFVFFSFLLSCTSLNRSKVPDVIVTSEPMLTIPEEGQVEIVKPANDVNLDSSEIKDLDSSEIKENKGLTLGENKIYFNYDQYLVEKNEDKEIIKRYADYLRKNKNAMIKIEGHTDERGSRSYNLALGEKRAEIVKEIMLISGALKNSIEVVSYGEESPAVNELNEEAYALNRRVEIIITKKQ